jgi:FMN phosphatase YigB (HAD superfamily)
VIERGEHHLRTFELLRPGFDLNAELAARRAAGVPERFDPADLYPDALDCLRSLRAAGFLVGVAGNQLYLGDELGRELRLPVDLVASSVTLGTEKPDAEFFLQLCREAGVQPSEAAYVGDRVDNDVLPAKRAGMVAVFIRRGPWGHLHATWPEVDQADVRIESLSQLPAALARLGSGT